MKGERIEKIRLEDGRHGERKVVEEKDCDTGEGCVVTELWEEEKRPLNFTTRVTEKTKPFVIERTVEKLDKGEVVETEVFSTEPKVELQLREHLMAVGEVEEEPAFAVKPRRMQAVAETKVKKSTSLDALGVALLVVIGVELAYLTVNWVIPWFTG
jgi:hypothetical protein